MNLDGKIAVVVMNSRDRSMEFQLWIDGGAAVTTSPARSIVTIVLKP